MESILSADENKNFELPLDLYQNRAACCALLEGIGLFELMGVSWMMALRYQNWSHEIHEHAYDEVRHTKMIQDCVRHLRWKLSDEEVLQEHKLSRVFYSETEKYLQNLSKRVFRLTYHQRVCASDFAISSYALLAFLIERRIMKIYPHLAKYGATVEVQEMAKQIIQDEKQHLTLVTGKLPEGLDFADSSKDEIILMEKNLADAWIGKLVAEYNTLNQTP